jgi:hypothetical protein
MSLEEKTKKWGCYHCSCCRFYHGFAKGCELPGGCAYILVSFAQQEIDKLKTFRDNAYKKWCDSQADLERERGLLKQKQRPHKILCLVGSTSPNWKNRYRKVLVELTKAGYICQTVVWFKDELENFEKHRNLLESIHFQKVRMSEAVILIHKDAVGKHTTMEMEYAKSLNMPVVTFENVEQCKKALEELLRE